MEHQGYNVKIFTIVRKGCIGKEKFMDIFRTDSFVVFCNILRWHTLNRYSLPLSRKVALIQSASSLLSISIRYEHIFTHSFYKRGKTQMYIHVYISIVSRCEKIVTVLFIKQYNNQFRILLKKSERIILIISSVI